MSGLTGQQVKELYRAGVIADDWKIQREGSSAWASVALALKKSTPSTADRAEKPRIEAPQVQPPTAQQAPVLRSPPASAGPRRPVDPGKDNAVFISYRRDGGAQLARTIQEYLESVGLEVFLDVDNLGAGHFDSQLLEHIERARRFLLICSPGALDRCADEDDWVRREIAHAIATERHIVPLIVPGFSMPDPESLPEDIQALPRHNGFEYSHSHWRMIKPRLAEMLGATVSDEDGSSNARQAALEVRPLNGFAGQIDQTLTVLSKRFLPSKPVANGSEFAGQLERTAGRLGNLAVKGCLGYMIVLFILSLVMGIVAVLVQATKTT